ncbi:hypothetical protein [Fictibacillus terranigra]|uniref:Uncharacterized protein n=1 Tax=Fictibacillus terranigra TaxID=3058424 RepID=A0ABT8EDN0_9BACL|nr:hypothetical protein [Fictibacillus sp. CENA-BCM004]MDN4076033.1 hypothetical protein [Fictibacillus sp. CENA-BCM004]
MLVVVNPLERDIVPLFLHTLIFNSIVIFEGGGIQLKELGWGYFIGLFIFHFSGLCDISTEDYRALSYSISLNLISFLLSIFMTTFPTISFISKLAICYVLIPPLFFSILPLAYLEKLIAPNRDFEQKNLPSADGAVQPKTNRRGTAFINLVLPAFC